MMEILDKHNIECKEFPQGTMRLKADTNLYKMYKSGTIINWNHPQLRQHALAASVKQQIGDDTTIRIIKPERAQKHASTLNETEQSLTKVDAVVAQSMSSYMAMQLEEDDSWGGGTYNKS